MLIGRPSTLQRAAWLGAPLLLVSCVMQNVSAEQALGDAVHELNDGVRWRRAVLVARRVADGYRDRFLQRHRTWGRSLHVADLEVLETRLDDGDMDRAESTIVVRWYEDGSMLLRETTVRQQWARVGPERRYALVEERVVEGDPRLFGEAAPAASAGGEQPGTGHL